MASRGNLAIFEKENDKRRNAVKEKKQRPLDLILADGLTHPHQGVFRILDARVDPSTGTMTLEAAFPNPRKILRPGQFARISAITEDRKGALLIPVRSVQELQGINQVAVIKDDDTLDMRKVTVGPRFKSFVIIEEGVSER